jgi:hypothetical protein
VKRNTIGACLVAREEGHLDRGMIIRAIGEGLCVVNELGLGHTLAISVLYIYLSFCTYYLSVRLFCLHLSSLDFGCDLIALPLVMTNEKRLISILLSVNLFGVPDACCSSIYIRHISYHSHRPGYI